MHWGLRAFERKRIERIALDHPYFDMHAPLLTKKELRTILAQGPRKTGPQVIAEVKNELGTAHAPATQKKRTLAEALRDASFVPSFRRAVVLGLLSLLLILFMTLTVPGRAFAEELYSLIVEFINGSLNAYSINPTPENDESSASLSLLPNDLQIPSELSGLIDHPVYISDDTVVSFFYNPHNSSGIVIKTIYETNDGVRYTIYQKIYNPNAHFVSDTEIDSSLMEFDSNLGFTMYAGTSDDGISLAVGFQEQCVIRVTSESLSVPEIIDVANSIYPV